MKKLFFASVITYYFTVCTLGGIQAQNIEKVFPGGFSGQIQFNDSGIFGGDENFIWNNKGKRLGIGTSLPAGLLELRTKSSINYPNLLLTEREGEFARLMFKNSLASDKNWTIAGNLNISDARSGLNFWYWNGISGKNLLSITGDGKVGIGTSNPTADLEVNGTVKISQNGVKIKEIFEIEGIMPTWGDLVTIPVPGESTESLRVLSFQVNIDNTKYSWVIPEFQIIAYSETSLDIRYEDYSSFKNKKYRITLMRVEK